MGLTLIITAAVAALLLLLVVGWIAVSSVSRQIKSGLPTTSTDTPMPPVKTPRHSSPYQPRRQRQENLHADIMAAAIVLDSASDCRKSTGSDNNCGDL